MAAAAIASGAVALPDVGVALGASVVGTARASVTATGLCVVIDSGCARTAGTLEESDGEAVPEDDFSADFAVPDFAAPDFVVDGWAALLLALAPALASDACPVVAAPELLLVVWPDAAVSPDWVLSAGADVLSEPRWEEDDWGAGDGCCAVGAALSVSAAVLLLSTSDPKLSPACDGSERAGFGGGA